MNIPALKRADKWLNSPRYAGTAEPTIFALKAALVDAYAVIATTTNREPAEYVRDEANKLRARGGLKVVSP